MQEQPKVVDLFVETTSPASLDATVNHFGAAVNQGGQETGYAPEADGTYRVRCFSNPDFVAFAIEHQGYGKVVGREEVKEKKE